MHNEVKKVQNTKRPRNLDHQTKPVAYDQLGPKRLDTSWYDYTPLRIPRANVLQQVKSLRILDKPIKMLSPPDMRNKSRYCRFHKDHKHDIKNAMNSRKP